MLKKVAALSLISAALASGAAFAGTTSTQINVQAVVSATCAVTNSGNINFGSVASTQAGASAVTTTQTSTLSVSCSNSGAPFSVQVDGGQFANNNGNQRAMSANGTTGPFLKYEVYQTDPATSAANSWPYFSAAAATTGTTTQDLATGNYITSVPIYARVLVGSTPASGTYTDTLTVTVAY